MNEIIIFRELKKTDYPVLEQIVRETWNYDRFCSPKTAQKLANLYLNSCLANQTFTQVALMGGVPVGIIMGKNRANHKCPFYLKTKMIYSIFNLYISKEGRAISKIFDCVEKIDKELLNLCSTNYQGELSFFAVSQKCRRKGIGKLLFEKFIQYIHCQNIKNFYLFTDTSCNYSFYEHQGMKRQQEKKHYFNINGKSEEMSFFLYDYHY